MKHVFIFPLLLVTSCLGANPCPIESWQEKPIHQWFHDNHDEFTAVTITSWDFMTVHYPEVGDQFGVKTNETVEIRLTYQVRWGTVTNTYKRTFFICGKKIRETIETKVSVDFL